MVFIFKLYYLVFLSRLLHFSGLKDQKFKIMEKSELHVRNDLLLFDRANGQFIHKVAFVIKQLNILKLTEILHAVSDPHSSTYGDHLSRTEVVKLSSSPGSSQTVIQYLNEHGILSTSASKYGDYIFADALISQWEELFSAEFFELEHKTKPGVKFVRSLQYSLPEFLLEHVDAVLNTVQLPSPHNSNDGTVHEKQATGFTTPFVLNQVYNIKNNTGNNLTTQAIYGNLHQAVSPLDLSLFQTAFDLPQYSVTAGQGDHVRDDACGSSISNCMEANLDVQYIMAIAQNTPTVYFYWTGDDVWLDWITTVANLDSPPDVFSISYGSYEFFMSPAYLNAFNVEAIKLGVMGTTLLAASGDDGVAGFAARILGPAFCDYQPMFPASSPYVTAVGGTMGPEEGKPEVACQSDRGGQITTGGGFSHTFPLPSWQADAVSGYLKAQTQRTEITEKTGITTRTSQQQKQKQEDDDSDSSDIDSSSGGCSGSGSGSGEGYPWQAPYSGYPINRRGYPDISALANRYIVAANGMFFQVSGTSASSPVMAGMVALVNSARRVNGNSTLGWLNPALYALYPAFANDIISGDNRCLAGNIMGPHCCEEGFFAAPGWDPVTGLGTIDFESFKNTMLGIHRPPKKAVVDDAQKGSLRGAATSTKSDTGGSASGIKVEPTRTIYSREVVLFWLFAGWLLLTTFIVAYKSIFRWNYTTIA